MIHLQKKIRYVGRSSNGLERPKCHWRRKAIRERIDHCHTWVRSVLALNSTPEIKILEFITINVTDSPDVIDSKLNEKEITIGVYNSIKRKRKNKEPNLFCNKTCFIDYKRKK